jgi:glyoxylase-like metal-dependent hydrolase (beta-lactamase superfamily II)
VQVEIFTSGIWQTTTTVLSQSGVCLVVDPAYFPRELEAIAGRVAEIGRAEAVAFTHGHWDHVMGHTVLPGAPVWLSRTLEATIAAGGVKDLDDARAFDGRWYVPRPRGYRWPDVRRPLADGDRVLAGDIAIEVLHLPGHSADGIALVAPGIACVGDYLSPCEIPFVEHAIDYCATLRRLIELAGRVERIVPGHGPVLSSAEAMAIAREDLAYLEGLLGARDADAARAVPLPRAADVPGMREHHLENVAKSVPNL